MYKLVAYCKKLYEFNVAWWESWIIPVSSVKPDFRMGGMGWGVLKPPTIDPRATYPTTHVKIEVQILWAVRESDFRKAVSLCQKWHGRSL